MPPKPTTFLFTDLENSTPLWEKFPDDMQQASALHDALMRAVIEQHRGRVVKTTGDGFHAVFELPSDGVAAALAGQQRLAAEDWPDLIGPLTVRMGLHTGISQERTGDCYGLDVNLAARIMGLGYGGQILLSQVTAKLVERSLPPDTTLIDLGEHRLKGIAPLERILQLCHPDLVADFPPLKSLAVYKHNLPRQPSSFIGRTDELLEIKRLIKGTPLLQKKPQISVSLVAQQAKIDLNHDQFSQKIGGFRVGQRFEQPHEWIEQVIIYGDREDAGWIAGNGPYRSTIDPVNPQIKRSIKMNAKGAVVLRLV